MHHARLAKNRLITNFKVRQRNRLCIMIVPEKMFLTPLSHNHDDQDAIESDHLFPQKTSHEATSLCWQTISKLPATISVGACSTPICGPNM